jgi:hypothetical protein
MYVFSYPLSDNCLQEVVESTTMKHLEYSLLQKQRLCQSTNLARMEA